MQNAIKFQFAKCIWWGIKKTEDQQSFNAHLTPGPVQGERFLLFSTILNMYIAPGHGHTTTWYKFWQHFKVFIISIIPEWCLLPHHFIWYFVLFHTSCIYSPREREDNPWGQFIWWKRKGLITLITGCMFQNNICALWFYAHFFMILYMYIAQAGADNPLGPKFLYQQKGLTLVICCKFKKNLFNFWFYTHPFMILYMYTI